MSANIRGRIERLEQATLRTGHVVLVVIEPDETEQTAIARAMRGRQGAPGAFFFIEK